MLTTRLGARQAPSTDDGTIVHDVTVHDDQASVDMPATSSPPEATKKDRAGGVGLALAIGVSSALSFAVHALASRQLSLSDYGALAAVLALMTSAAVPVGAVQTALTRSAAEVLASGQKPSGRPTLRFVFFAALSVVCIVAALSPLGREFIRIPTTTPILLGGVWIAVVLLGSVGKALLIADSQHRPVAHAVLHGSLFRLVAAAVVTPVFGVSGGIAAAVIGDILSTFIYASAAARRGFFASDGVPIRIEWPDAGRALSSQLSLWLFASVAVVVGRRTLSGSESGSFAAMATVAAACLVFPQTVATMVFPRFVADGGRAILLRATGLAAVVGAACALAISVRPKWLFSAFFGPQYVPNQLVLTILCAHFVVLGCLAVITQYVVARRHGGSLVVWCGLIITIAAASRFGHSPLTVANSLILPTMAVTLFVSSRAIFPKIRDSGTHADTPVIDLRPKPTVASGRQLSAGDRLATPATLAVSIVIPTYNGGDALFTCVKSIRDTFDETGFSYELIVMVDGSTDGSERELHTLGENVVIELGLVNIGKGAVLRRGFASARGAFIGFIDGDGDISPRVLIDLIEKLHQSNAWIAAASKNKPGAVIAASPRRRIMSAGYRVLVHWMFDLHVTDTQCGCKIFRREFLAATIDHARENGFALDLELLTIGSRMGLKEAVEVPVILAREELSTVSTSTVFRMLSDTFRIHRRVPQATFEPLPVTSTPPVGVDFASALSP